MLPPHRPFREKPTPKAVVKKRPKPTSHELAAAGSRQGKRFELKRELVILNDATDTSTS